MDDDRRHGKDEMNLAVLPIAKLGRSDTRNSIEYYGTFTDKNGQKEMTWTVHGADKLGLPGEYVPARLLIRQKKAEGLGLFLGGEGRRLVCNQQQENLRHGHGIKDILKAACLSRKKAKRCDNASIL